MSELKALGKKVEAPTKIDPSVLEPIPVPVYFTEVSYVAHEFTSLCPVTGQPDFGELQISITPYSSKEGVIKNPEALVESKSLKLYLQGFRNTGMFHEEICSVVARDICKMVKGYVYVAGSFASRGGISIRPKASCYPDE